MTAILKHPKILPRLTASDVMACLPVLTYGTVALVVYLAYRDVGYWPVISSPGSKVAELDFTGARKALLILLPLVAVPLCFVSMIAVALSTASDLTDSEKTSRRKIAFRGVVQLAVSICGVVLFLPVLGRILIWVLD
jgi:hypothetical protein